jgi:hypothetical protein
MSKFRVLGCISILLVVPALGLAQKQSKNMVPALNSISPTSATAGGTSFTLTATGSNFTSGSVVQWNGSALPTTVVSSTQLQASVAGSLIASAGSIPITVYTSGRYGGTSNGLTFTINAPTTSTTTTSPPPPSPDPLTITTTSVPGATAGTSYSTSLAASGGTPAYGWSTVSGGGSLPPGLTLAANGALSGTPTTAGTYSFTVQAQDSASTPQAAQKQFSLTVAAPPTTTTTTTSSTAPLFQTGFESGAMPGGFDSVWNTTDVTQNTNPQFVHSGTGSAQIYYHICGATDGSCGGASQDLNRYFNKYFNSTNGYPNGLDHLFVRGYVYFKSPEPGGTKDGVQRKIWWWADSANAWSFFISSDSANGQIPLRFSTNGNAYVPAYTYWNIATIGYDQWYCLEIEVQLNTPGMSDGLVTLWLNGTQVWQKTGLNLRGSYTTGIQYTSPGRQVNRYNYNPISEYRYWDDIVMSTGYIGP